MRSTEKPLIGNALEISSKRFERKMPVERVLGKYSSGFKGPALIITADILGNEFSGISAFLKVLDTLTKLNLPIRGEITGLAGNIGASKNKGLLMGLDQNTSCFTESGFLYNHGENQGYNEAGEFVDLIEEFEKAQHAIITEIFYLDLKTCPSIRHPYVCVNKNLHCIHFTENLPLYTVKGLEDYITDHMGFYLNAKGYIGCTIKGGPYGPLSSVQIQEAAIWLALVCGGCLEEKEVPNFALHHKTLNRTRESKEATSFEVIYKYTVQEDEFFRMIPGYINFQKINKGEVLATSDGGTVLSEWDGRIFMPLYHTQGQDGFFILKESG
ncbi:MAG: hypothetical protein WD426_17875 [Anditalea sp.]